MHPSKDLYGRFTVRRGLPVRPWTRPERLRLPQHPDPHRPQRSVLLAVDQESLDLLPQTGIRFFLQEGAACADVRRL